MSEASIYEVERSGKAQKLRELGVDPYGGAVMGVKPLAEIRALHRPEFLQDGGPVVKAAGRIMLKRDMGKLSFLTLRDESGDLQIAFDKRRLDETAWKINELLDLGDQIIVEGPLGQTKKLEPTVWATKIGMAAKALLPPPAKWEGLSDVELRYRQRYVDLWANPEVMKTLKLRIRIVDEVRNFLRSRGYIEVETPMMQALAGGAAARPFETHHNALDIPLYLRIAPELYLKRLLVGGFTKVFELNRNFRNEGISPRHNPEFTMLEAYEAFGSWETMAEMVESMICHVAKTVFGTLQIEHRSPPTTPVNDSIDATFVPAAKTIDLLGDDTRSPGTRWRRVRMVDLVKERTGWKFDKRPLQDAYPDLFKAMIHNKENELHDFLRSKVEAHATMTWGDGTRTRVLRWAEDQLRKLSPAQQLVEIYEKLIEHTLVDPTFVTHVPSVIIPLAKKAPEPDVPEKDWFFADVYELAINGQEISPGYTELNDPAIQAENFNHQVGEDQQKVDEDFLTALKYGMPPAGGMGLGIDRLVMMLTGAESIRDVILFPLMKPQEKGGAGEVNPT